VCWLIAHSVNVYVSYALLPDPPAEVALSEEPATLVELPPDAAQMAQSILSSGLFTVPPRPSAIDRAAAETPASPPPPPIELTGKLKLLGTAIGDRVRPSAAIEHLSDHSQKLYFLQETIEGFGQLAVVTKEGVTIRQGNREGFLPLADTSPQPMLSMPILVKPSPAKSPALPRMIDRRQLKQNLSDVSKLLTEARAMPYYDLTNNGKIEGWQLIDIKPKSILDQLGIQQRDVMLRINGTPVVDPGTMLRLLQELQHEHVVKVDLIRGGERQTLTYEIR
jgi:type II secretion system protein C